MNEIQYLNEHTTPGILGNFFIVLSFVAAIFSTFAYFQATRHSQQDNPWRIPARVGFMIHGAAVFGIIGTLLYILTNHLYEYKYAWDHLNNAMPLKYVFSCMWEGQEGSFLLWSFWHVVLGLMLMFWSRGWEPWVMCIVSLVQVFLASMLLGVFFGEFQFGSNPFTLLREAISNVGLPWTQNPDYLSLQPFRDGKGLNPLLQNYWMTIHPPTLFLGFASTLIPFAYAIAGLWRKDHTGWMKPAIPWAFFGVMILGTGILMGGAWAYEALGFGGFWAWDPVENASLVPWLTFVASAHLLAVNQRRQSSTFSALVLTLSTFILVLYSTFLTRSGVLGDSSVHSFVDSGILAQLLVYLLFFTALSTWLMIPMQRLRIGYLAVCSILFVIAIGDLLTDNTVLTPEQQEQLLPGEGTAIPALALLFLFTSIAMLIVAYFKRFRQPASAEEALWSREFWMFIGALILTISAFHITFMTSVNVGNIFLTPFEDVSQSLHESTGANFFKRLAAHDFNAPGESERFNTYHSIQVPLAFLLMIVIGIGQWLKYKNTDFRQFRKKLLLSIVLSIVTLMLMIWAADIDWGNDISLVSLIWTALFALFSNVDYGWRVLRGKADLLGASVAHVGFAMLIIGAVISTWQSHFISRNTRGNVADLNEDFNNNEDLMILQGDTLAMGPYMVHYKEKRKEGDRIYCVVEYFDIRPRVYTEGEYVRFYDMTFRARETHTASTSFLEDTTEDSLWTQVTPAEVDAHAAEHIAEWRPGTPGERLFVLEPTVLMSPKGNSREPSIEHFAGHDLYTFIKHTDTEMRPAGKEGYLDPISKVIPVKQEFRLTETINMRVDSIQVITDFPENLPEGLSGKRVMCTLDDGHDQEILSIPMLVMNGTEPFTYPVESQEHKMLFAMRETPEGLELTVQKHASLEKDLLILSAEVFPQINILWLGCIVMVIGTTMAIRHRIRLARQHMNADREMSTDSR